MKNQIKTIFLLFFMHNNINSNQPVVYISKYKGLLGNQLFQFCAAKILSEELGIPADAKEALCFAYLGWRSLGGLPGSLKEATGISKPQILGSVAFT